MLSPAPRRLLDNDDEQLDDRRFRNLLAPEDWTRLPADVRRRFSEKPDIGAHVYSGHVVSCRLSSAGWMLAQILRVLGAPLPIADTSGLPTVVTVTEEGASGGQHWTRIFSRRIGFPQVIHSTKRFLGPTGLEEYIGAGIRMALTLSVANGTLFFSSAGYFVEVLRWTIRLPRWLEPGRTIVSHRDLGNGAFLFALDLEHPWFGLLVHQEALYREVNACAGVSY
jgi:hypothetical protein